MADLRVNFCGVELKNPITTASGTFGFGHEYGEYFDLSQLGGIGVKGLTPTERLGNPAPRIAAFSTVSACRIRASTALSRSRSRSCASMTPRSLPTYPATR